MNDDDPPTHRSSGSLAIFENTAKEALVSLESLGLDERGEELAHEARELITVFVSWAAHLPSGEDRATAISRVMDLHRNVGEYLTQRRTTPQ